MEEDLLQPVAITAGAAGNKAARLAQMQGRGFAVPAFACVGAGCMRRHLAPYQSKIEDIAGRLRQGKTTPQAAAEALQNLLAGLQLEETVCRQVAGWAAQNGGAGQCFAVRSSALAEDGTAASFAGQFATRLWVKAGQLPAAIVQCWRSAFCAGVLQYAKEQATSLPLYMGVVLQRMVRADTSGVLFTANPRGLLNEMVVVLGRSTGDGVVEDKVPTTTAYYHRTDKIYYTESQQGAPEMPPLLLEELAKAGDALEGQLGAPADVEFAVEEGKLWLLQLRPITALPGQGAAATVLDNSNIVESYPGLSLPLTASFARQIYYGVFCGVARRCLPSEKLVQAQEETLRNMVASANGRMYYQISNWYNILKFLPMQAKIIPVWQRMMGVKNPQYNKQKTGVTPWQRLRTWGRILRSAVGIPKKMAALHQDFLQVQRAYNQRFSPGAGSGALLDLYDEIAETLLDKWDITLLNDMYAFVFTGLLQKHLAKKMGDKTRAEAKAAALVARGGPLASMQPVQKLGQLAAQAAQNPPLLGQLAAFTSNQQVQRYLAGHSSFARQLAQYIEEYGDRSVEELKLESETFRTAPLLLVQTLLSYAANPDALAGVAGAAQPLTPPQNKAGEGAGWLAAYYARHARTGIEGRETSRLDRSRIFGMVRGIFGGIGQNFAGQGLLQHPRDIFYLTIEEIFAAVRKAPPAGGFAALVAWRKQQYEGFAQLPAYTRLIFAGPIFDKTPKAARVAAAQQGQVRFTGTPCAPGRAKGRVRLVHTPAAARQAEGCILVTPTTDPGWAFLLATARGVISEKGSVLSHTAIIARELGVPLIVDLPGIMGALQEGDEVQMDAETGEIEVTNRG